MAKNSHEKEPETLPKDLKYTNLPADMEGVIESGERAVIVKESRITVSKKDEYITRFPKEIVKGMGMNPDDRIRYILRVPRPNTEDKPELVVELVRK